MDTYRGARQICWLRHWSKMALLSLKEHVKVVTSTKKDPEDALRHEHLFPRKQTIEKLFTLNPPTIEKIQEILSVNIGVVVTVKEEKQLVKEGVFEDPWKRYRDAGIEWEEIDDCGAELYENVLDLNTIMKCEEKEKKKQVSFTTGDDILKG